eukprot:763642-Hanusia_phi.AAC.1
MAEELLERESDLGSSLFDLHGYGFALSEQQKPPRRDELEGALAEEEAPHFAGRTLCHVRQQRLIE